MIVSIDPKPAEGGTTLDQIETEVAAHYTTGQLIRNIDQALEQIDVDPAAVTAEDLKTVDEFHTGGLEATDALLEQLEIGPQTRVLDLGCGIGGPARVMAERFGCHVTGIDLTREFVACAAEMTRRVGLHSLVDFRHGSVLDLPFDDDSFDVATLFHVGMNIADKDRLMTEAARVLRPGGTLAVFDVMGVQTDAIVFPMPWAEHATTSFLAPPDAYAQAARDAGFAEVARRDRSGFAAAFFEKVFARAEAEGPVALGIHLFMRDTAAQKLQNYASNLSAGRIAPTELILRLSD